MELELESAQLGAVALTLVCHHTLQLLLQTIAAHSDAHIIMKVKSEILVFKTCIKKEASKVKHTANKAKQHSTRKAVTFPNKNELPWWVELTTLYTLDRAPELPLSYQGSSAGWAQISHLIVHLMNRLTCS